MPLEKQNLQAGVCGAGAAKVIEDLVLDILWKRGGRPCPGAELRQRSDPLLQRDVTPAVQWNGVGTAFL